MYTPAREWSTDWEERNRRGYGGSSQVVDMGEDWWIVDLYQRHTVRDVFRILADTFERAEP